MDTELFMECEEEELEPWQQIDDCVEEEDEYPDYMEPVEESPGSSPLPESPPPAPPPAPAPKVPVLSQIQTIPSVPIATSTVIKTTPTVIKTTPPATSAPPLTNPAPPLILSQLPQGTFLVPITQGFPGVPSGTPLVFSLPPGSTVLQPSQTVLKPGQTVLNPGQTVLNPGQTVLKPGQPLTLIQSPSLGQLVHPVTPVRGSTPSTTPGLVHLTVRSSTPERVPPGGAVSSLTPTGSTNGVPRTITILSPPRTTPPAPLRFAAAPARFTSPAAVPAAVAVRPPVAPGPIASPRASFSQPRVVSLPSSLPSDSSRVVMSVEEFYYGTFDGDEVQRDSGRSSALVNQFPCHICSHRANNNLRLMQHMLTHWRPGNRGDEVKSCKFCYRHFSSALELKTHLDQVHGPAPCSSLCRICEWAFDNEPLFLNHMKTNHKPGEMPYICQICSYRSSFYSDVIQHFATFHRESRFLLCVFCLKVHKNPASYQQHLMLHQNEAFHCNRCRLQFIVLREKLHHKTEHHRSFRRPARLEGLPPGSKVTIRTIGRRRPMLPSEVPHTFPPGPTQSSVNPAHSNMIQPISIKSEPQALLIQKTHPSQKKPHPQDNKAPAVSMWRCVECFDLVGALSAHYPTCVRCLLCKYATCCSRAYASHMIHSHHFPRSKDSFPRLNRDPPPSRFSVICSDCKFSPDFVDEMAVHLALNPTHGAATCTPLDLSNLDLDFSLVEPLSLVPPLAVAPASDWSTPDCDDTVGAPEFGGEGGPKHQLLKNSDAMEFFLLLFPTSLLQLIVTETNANVRARRFLSNDPLLDDWTPLTLDELKGFLGLVILMGQQSLPDRAQYWSYSHYDHSYLFSQVMTHRRFSQILQSVCPDRLGPTPHKDPLRMFRKMLDLQGRAMWDAYRPNACLSLDCTVLPGTSQDQDQDQDLELGPSQDLDLTRSQDQEQRPIQDQEPSRRDSVCPRSGATLPQVWLLCDSKSGYCHRLHIQTAPGPHSGPPLTPDQVLELLSGLENHHHQVFVTNALCTVDLLTRLHQSGVYGSASFPRKHPHFPATLWNERPLEAPGDFVQKQSGVVLATRWMDMKEMGCLSTNALPGQTDRVFRRAPLRPKGLDSLDRPLAFRLLQENMRGVDICKQLLACNTLAGVGSERRWTNLFWFLVNISIINSFIVLRETRRDCPPSWVHNGLFTQARFRRRLGMQLAKCFQRHTPAEVSPRVPPLTAPPPLAPHLQRHRLVAVSKIKKRCHHCRTKNLRRESRHGCTQCRVSLCKRRICFWEYHGLSAHTNVSAKVGFVMNIQTGKISFDDQLPGEELNAPIDESDESDESEDEDDEDDVRRFKEERAESPESVDQSLPSVLQELFSERQLQIALSALCEGVAATARVFSTEPPIIRRWLREANTKIRAELEAEPEAEPDVEAELDTEPESDDGNERLVKFILSTREQQGALTYTALFNKVSALKQKGAMADGVRFSYDWAVSFMLRNRLALRGVSTRIDQELPPALSERIPTFQTFTRKVVKGHALVAEAVAAMDELCLFANLGLIGTKSRLPDVLQTVGSAPLVTMVISALSDGTLLPSLVLANAALDEKSLPESVLVDSASESEEEALDVWRSRVWAEHVRDCGLKKSLLILDTHREHDSEAFLASVSDIGTLPALIPKGLAHRLQPLQVCVTPVLQRYVLRRWRQLTAADTAPPPLDEAGVKKTLLRWTIEALELIGECPDLIRSSFDLTGVCDGGQDEHDLRRIQEELTKTLSHRLKMEEEKEEEEEEEEEEERSAARDSETDTEDETGLQHTTAQRKNEEGGEEEMKEGGEEERKVGGEEERKEGGEEEMKEGGEEERKVGREEERKEGGREQRGEQKDKMDTKNEEEGEEMKGAKDGEDNREETGGGEKKRQEGREEGKEMREGTKREEGEETRGAEEEEKDKMDTKNREVAEKEREEMGGETEEEEQEKMDEGESEEKEKDRMNGEKAEEERGDEGGKVEERTEEGGVKEEERARPRGETRILMGADLGDEWQMEVQSSEENDSMEQS